MHVETYLEIQNLINLNPTDTIGLVPTMGALHEGHLFLIQEAQKDCDRVVVSIFVNPTQFNDPKDLSKYPRTLNEDLAAIEKIGDEILVYTPNVEEVYPNGAVSETFDFGSLSKYMEGQFREGHFEGVGSVLKRLFELVKPQKAYFGEKDFQQLAVVKKLVTITGQDVDIVGCETYREANGLAKSSRNKLLSEKEKLQASIIYKCLNLTRKNFGIKPISEIKKIVKATFESSKLFKLEYFEIAADDDLVPTNDIDADKTYRAFIAAYCNGVRLIDNMALNS